jgi:type IV pilus assembly protein PilM
MMKALSKIIPPPNYLTMPAVGIDISDTSLKYVSFKPFTRGDKVRKLDKWGEISIPTGIISGGVIDDVGKLSAVLSELKATTKAELVRVSLPEERAYLFETEIRSQTPCKEIRNLLEFKLEENVPIPSRDVFFDFEIIEQQEQRKNYKIVVVAYPAETIEQYYGACLQAGLRPLSFEVEAQAVSRAVIPKDIKGAVMLVDFGKTRTGVGIVYKNTLLYTSTIDIGGARLSEMLRKILGNDIDESELSRIKNTEGLVRGLESSAVHDALIGTISNIKDEMITRMQYWHGRPGNTDERRISSIFLCGGSANLKGLPAYLSDSVGIPCVRANVWENAFSLENNIPPIDYRHSFGYATAIGLALKSLI